jgi:hypothetical protein
MNISLVHDVYVSAVELVTRFNVPSAIVPVLVAIKLEADISSFKLDLVFYDAKHPTDYFETTYQGPKLNIARVASSHVLEATLLLELIVGGHIVLI